MLVYSMCAALKSPARARRNGAARTKNTTFSPHPYNVDMNEGLSGFQLTICYIFQVVYDSTAEIIAIVTLTKCGGNPLLARRVC